MTSSRRAILKQAPTPTLPRRRGRGFASIGARIAPSPACGGGLGWGLTVLKHSRLGRAGFDRRVAGEAPFRPRPVIDRGAGMADQMERKGERAGRHPRAAAGHDRAIEADPGLLEQQRQLLGAAYLPGARVGDLVERHIAAAWDMAAPPAGPGLFDGAIEAAGGPGIDDLLAGPGEGEVGEQRPLVAHQRGVEMGDETTWWNKRRGGLEWATLRLPFRHPAIEQRDVLVSVEAQHPPRAPGRGQTDAVVDDDPFVIADAALRHFGREPFGRGDHVR